MTAPEQPTPLLPCPFCGEPAEHDSQRWRPPTRPHFTSATGHAVTCSKCESEVGLFECYEDAAEAWNRRFVTQRAAEAVETDADAMSERNFVDEFRPIIDQLLDLGREVEDRGLANEDRVTQSALAFLRQSLEAPTPPPGDAGERARQLAQIVARYAHNEDVGCPEMVAEFTAALQSERTAAASQARRETLEECAKWHISQMLRYAEAARKCRAANSLGKAYAFEDRERFHRASIDDIRALATPPRR